MKLLKFIGILLISMTIGFKSFGQVPTAPGPGTWVLLQDNLALGSTVQGNTKTKIYFENNLSTLVTGVQFRVFYDNMAFSEASVILLSTGQFYMQQLDNNAGGYITITLVYTGSSSTFTIPNGEMFELTLTHVGASQFNSLLSIAPLTFEGSPSYPLVAATQVGVDAPLTTNFGSVIQQPVLTYNVNFRNVTGTPAKYLPFSLEKKLKTGGSWSLVNSYMTDTLGKWTVNEILDTTYWDVRLSIQGDTMTPGNAISVADAQKINQFVVETLSPTAWDFYTSDVNGDGNVNISDASSVFGRIAGRMSSWPNGVKEVKFFSQSEWEQVNFSTSNLSQSITGTVNITWNILPNQPDSVNFYVLVNGDANNTGYHMARLIPIEILNPSNSNKHLIDESVEYDNLDLPTIEVRVPNLSVSEGNLVKLPVKVFTNGNKIGSLQFALKYDETLVQFREITNSEKTASWLSFVNPNNGVVEWGGYDRSGENLLEDGETVFTANFIAQKPQGQWGKSPLYTTRKFVGNDNCSDMNITPTNGILQIKAVDGVSLKENEILVYPNPTTGDIVVKFNVPIDGNVNLVFINERGDVVLNIINEWMPSGDYSYVANLKDLRAGNYFATLITPMAISINKTVLIK
jgi:hypothetical protein